MIKRLIIFRDYLIELDIKYEFRFLEKVISNPYGLKKNRSYDDLIKI
jgi:hypothetical protein